MSMPPAGSGFSLAALNLKYERRRVRFAGSQDNPAVVAVDVGDILEITNISQALRDFDDDEKGITDVYTIAGKQTLLILYEPGLYRLICNSR